ncbi:DUF4411 family protein [Paraburkholderia sp. Ac-20340]|uniref:DUF4411 family protein n=1 Tax=Paraburkholderia sp. Ac-20340 TaxID=2703888 RepID=UPI00197E02EA|nr:DUF4411 family protein [Paraburkholderia sp. Ac-20340]MBN3854602.1 DUF4411 family protein [Paraburkholderia sp. Ac-20340]
MYLLDSNIFIEAQNRYYANDICPGFWNWLDDANARGLVASIGEVYSELAGRGDSLASWIEARHGTGWFLDVSDELTQRTFAEVAQHVESVARYTRPNKSLFLGGADPWLIAKAKTMGWGVATHEQFSDNSTKVKIPNVCRSFEVNTRDTFDVLRQLQATFGWSRAH